MTTPSGPTGPGYSPARPPDPDQSAERSLPVVALVAAIAALLVAVVAIVLVLDDDNTTETIDTTTTSQPTTTTTTTSSAPASTETVLSTTTSAEPTTSQSTTSQSTTSESVVDATAYESAVWPWPNAAAGAAAQRFDDPVDAAESFAVDFVGFTDPVVGNFQAGDSRSGEVEIRNREDGPATTVFVRQLGADDTWWVLGSATGDILIERPEALQLIGDQLVVKGEARTFEGNVEVILRGDGLTSPIFTGTVTGRGDGTFGPFEESFAIDAVVVDAGAALFLARSAEDGSVWQAGVIRVRFAG